MRANSFISMFFALGVALTERTTLAAEAPCVVRRGPLPTWVVPLPMPSRGNGLSTRPSDVSPPVRSENNFRYLIDDEQTRYADGQPQSFIHLAYVVDRPSDVQYGSELEARVYPEFEQLTIHFVRIHRGGKTLDALKTAELRLLNAESDRERFMYDNGKDVVVVLKDVRQGDTIEWAYTTEGQNPAVEGRVLAAPRLARNRGIKSFLVRLLVAPKSNVQYRLHGVASAPNVAPFGKLTEYRWEQGDVMAVDDEGDTPSWYVPEPWVEFSDFSSWAEVAAWALPLYSEPKTLPSELEALVLGWQRLSSDSQRLLAALRFVQEELRYLGMEIGPHSLKPHPPAQTFEQRFGDCKDKTLLLVTVLHRLGIKAVPALVASRAGRLLPERLPSPYAFDHVIAKVSLGSEVYWLDPTISSERGDLRARKFCEYGYALPIAAETTRLEPLAREPSSQPLSEIEERYDLGDLASPVTLTVNTWLRGSRADEFRSRYESQSLREIKRDYVNFFAKRYDDVTFLGEPTVVDDEGNNVVTIQERYRISGVFRENEALLSAWSFEELLGPPDIVQRKSPLYVSFPFVGQHRILLSYDVEPRFELPNFEEQDGALRFAARGSIDKDRHYATVTYTLASLDDAVPVEGIAAHLALRRRIDSHSGLRLERRLDRNPATPSLGFRPAYLGALSAGALLSGLLFGTWRLRRRRHGAWPTKAASLVEPSVLGQGDESSVSSLQ